jgi:cadmium resistance protein CadD (predicted permease)
MALILISALSYFLKLIIPLQWIGLLGIVPIIIGLKKLKDLREENNNFQDLKENRGIFKSKGSKTFLVSSVTIANGGDNIGVYIPIFTSINIEQALVIILTFVLMIGLWCLALNWSIIRC